MTSSIRRIVDHLKTKYGFTFFGSRKIWCKRWKMYGTYGKKVIVRRGELVIYRGGNDLSTRLLLELSLGASGVRFERFDDAGYYCYRLVKSENAD